VHCTVQHPEVCTVHYIHRILQYCIQCTEYCTVWWCALCACNAVGGATPFVPQAPGNRARPKRKPSSGLWRWARTLLVLVTVFVLGCHCTRGCGSWGAAAAPRSPGPLRDGQVSVTLSLCHCVTVSLCHSVTVSLCHSLGCHCIQSGVRLNAQLTRALGLSLYPYKDASMHPSACALHPTRLLPTHTLTLPLHGPTPPVSQL